MTQNDHRVTQRSQRDTKRTRKTKNTEVKKEVHINQQQHTYCACSSTITHRQTLKIQHTSEKWKLCRKLWQNSFSLQKHTLSSEQKKFYWRYSSLSPSDQKHDVTLLNRVSLSDFCTDSLLLDFPSITGGLLHLYLTCGLGWSCCAPSDQRGAVGRTWVNVNQVLGLDLCLGHLSGITKKPFILKG